MTRPLTKMNPHRRHAAPGVRSAHVLVAALTLAFAAPVGAVSCTTFFPDGLTADDEIKFESGSQLQGSPDNLLFTAQLDDNSGSTNSCSSTDCGIDSSFGSIADINHTSFPGGNDLEVDENQTGSFSPGNYDKLKLEENSTATLSPGVYTFKEEGEFKEDSTLNISPAGTVEMYFKKEVEADEDTTVTSQSTGSTLFIWSKKKIEIGENSNWEAFLYSRQEEIKLKENSTLTGAATSKSKEIELKEDSTVVYNATGAQNATFGSHCQGGGGGNAAPVLAGVDSSTLAYNKGDPATPIAASITVSDSDDTDLVSAAVTLVNADNAEDVLSVTIAQGSPISASYSAPTLTLSGTGTLAQYQTVLRTVSYSNSDTTSPTTTTRTAQFTVNDGTADSNVATRSISIIDTACTRFFPDGLSAGLSGGDKIEFESGSQLQGSPDNLLVAANLDDDSGSTNSCNATNCAIDSSSTSIPDMDQSSFPGGSDLEVDENQTGSFSPGDYDELKLEQNSTATLSPGVYIFKKEGEFKQNSTLNISPAGTVEMYFKKKVESEDDTTVTSQSTGSTLLIWSKKEIEIGEDSTWEAFLYAVKDIKLKDDATLTGAATTEDDIKLEDNATVVYNATGAQYATFGSHCQGNAPPALANVDSSTLAYTEEDPPAAIAPNITVSDSDDTDLVSAVVTLVNADNAEDVLSVTVAQGSPISATYSAPTLTLSGTGTLAQYQAALRTVSYSNSDTNSPTTTTRTAQFTVNDGTANSNVATRDISITDTPEQNLSQFSINVGGGSASTCQPFAIVITAQNSAGNTVTDYDGTITVSTSSGNGVWSYGTNSPSLPGNLGSSSGGQVSYNFSGSENGTVTLNLSNTRAESLTVAVADTAASVSSTSSTLSYSANTFVITSVDALGDDVVAGRSHLFRVQMLTQAPGGGANCLLASDYTSSSLQASVVRTSQLASAASPQILSTTVPNSPQSASVGIQMSGGTADFNLATSDVGQYSITLTDTSNSYSDSSITGTSAQFTVRPFGLQLSIPTNPEGATAQGSAFKTAGETFQAQVTAKGWASQDDANNDGVPDTFVDSNYTNNTLSGATLASFGSESPAETVQLSAVSLLPSSLGSVTLGNALTSPNDGRIISGFSSGTGSTSDIFYENVGAIALSATVADGNYLDIGTSQTAKFAGTSAPVGRFTAAHYTLHTSSYTAACTNSQPFSYFGQTVTGSVTLRAHASTGTVVTAYEGDLVKLDLSSGTKAFTARDLVAGSASLSSRLTTTLGSFTWSQGAGSLSSSHVMNRAASPDGPYSSTSLGLQVSDTDGIGLSLSALNIDSTGDGTADSALAALLDLRHGRIRMEGGSAAPADTLSAIFRTEYFNGSDWSTMSIDNCTAIARSAVTYPDGAIDDGDNLNVTVGGGQTTGSYASMTSSQINFQSGDAGQTFSAPGAGNIGAFSVTASVSAQPWLQFDWDGDGQHDDASLPAAQYDFSSFFRGHDRVLYWGQQ